MAVETEGDDRQSSGELTSFLDSGIFRLGIDSGAVFLDPVRLFDDSYSRFRLCPSAYYSRSFGLTEPCRSSSTTSGEKRKRQKRKRSPRELNQREMAAEQRHHEARPFLVKAHEDLLRSGHLLALLPGLGEEGEPSIDWRAEDTNFIELGKLWQAPLYEICVPFSVEEGHSSGPFSNLFEEKELVPMFNNLISNAGGDDVVAEFLSNHYILPKYCSFHMSDLTHVRDLIPVNSDCGYNLIVIDPPWENGSVHQKGGYPTLPNKNLLYLPIKQLAHTEGALVVLWITNREKLCIFAEELFSSWGVDYTVSHYWLKVKPDGSLIGEMDLFHHRPYERFLLGYVNCNSRAPCRLRNNQVILSIPGAHSRKPPLGKLLYDYIPGPKPSRCIELFARDLVGGWTSWGNEALRFQDSRYFLPQVARS